MALAVALSGCVMQRRITSVAAHPDRNNYKFQTETVKVFLSAIWLEWHVWSCKKMENKFLCKSVEMP